MLRDKKGQILFEALLGIAVAAIVLGIASSFMVAGLGGVKVSIEQETAMGILEGTLDGVKAVAFENWMKVFNPPDNTNTGTPNKGSANLYHIAPSDSTNAYFMTDFSATAGTPRWGTATQLNSTSSTSPSNVWVGGNGGELWQWNGLVWKEWTEFGTTDVTAVATVKHDDVVIVGKEGKRYRYNGSTVTQNASSDFGTTDINALSIPHEGSAWAVGNSGKVKFGSTTAGWTTPGGSSFGTTNLYAVSAIIEADRNNCSAALIAGASGTVKTAGASTCTGELYTWTDHTPPDAQTRWGNTTTIRAVSLISRSNLWLSGDSGAVWQCTADCFSASAAWVNHTPADAGTRWGTTTSIKSISAFGTSFVMLVGENGHFWQYDGTNWTQISGTGKWGTNILFGIADRYSTDIFIVGQNGKAWQYDPVKWQIATGETTETVGGTVYTKNFYIQNVCRDRSTRAITGVTDSGGTSTACADTVATDDFDLGTLKLTARVRWAGGDLTLVDYITRWKNVACKHTEWQTAGAVGAKFCGSTDYDTINNPATGTPTLTTGASLSNPVGKGGYLQSAIFDTRVSGGAMINSISWLGDLAGGTVKLAIAGSNCLNGSQTGSESQGNCGAGGWSYKYTSAGVCTSTSGGLSGGTSIGSGVPLDIARCFTASNRYYKYHIMICPTDCSGAVSNLLIRVTDVIVNYSY